MNKILKRCLIVVLLLTFLSIINYCSAPHTTKIAKVASVRNTVTGSGFILRNETVITQDSNSVFECTAKDGSRLSRGSSIGVAIRGNLNKALATELNNVTKRIEEIEQSESFANIYASDEARIYTALKDFSESIRSAVYEENFSVATEKARQLSLLLEKNRVPENGLAADQLLLSLRERKYELEQKLGGIRENVVAPASGYFYRKLDGMENSGTEKEIAALSPKQVNGFSNRLKSYKRPANDIGKVVDTYVWYLAATVDAGEAEKLTPGNTVTVSIDDAQPVEATVLAVNRAEEEGKESAIIIKCTRDVADIYDKRTADFEICYEEHHGLKVPAEAIRVKNSVTGVYVLSKSNTVVFKCVDVLWKEKSFYIVRRDYTPPENVKHPPLRLYDEILTNPEAID